MNKEDRNIEYKQSWHGEYLKWTCGFANAQRGQLSSPLAEQKRMRKAGRSIETSLCVAEQYRGDGMIRRIFISSVQRELAKERKAIADAVFKSPQLASLFSRSIELTGSTHLVESQFPW